MVLYRPSGPVFQAWGDVGPGRIFKLGAKPDASNIASHNETPSTYIGEYGKIPSCWAV